MSKFNLWKFKIGMKWSMYTVKKQFDYLKMGNYIIININSSKNIVSYFGWKFLYYFLLIHVLIVDKFIAFGDKILFKFK